MSETDDTDELLLIPPDFFVSNPALDYPTNLGPYYNVVDNLITQVTQLEDRINFIESSSEIGVSLTSESPDMNSPMKLCSSAQSTPQKPRTKFTLNSLPNTPADIQRLPQKKVSPKAKKSEINPMLGEIDSFLSNVKYIKRLNTVRNLENEFNSNEGNVNPNAKNLDLNEVNDLLKKMEIEKPCVREKLWQAGDNISSVPDYGYGMRANMYAESKKTYTLVDSSIDKSDSSSESTRTTTYDQCKYKRKEGSCSVNDDYNLGLVSLSKLWGSSDLREIPGKFQQKLQEERLRRQHCEQAIQELQNRVLELQERVAVAIQVDEAKDKAILRFHESWEKAGTRLQDIEKQKERLEEEVEKLKKKLNEDSDETNQKIAHYEKEASLALNIAHSGQDKLAVLERRCQQVEAELRNAEIDSEDFQKKYLAETEKNRQYPEILAQKELELNDCRLVLGEARKEVSQSKKAIEACQSELLVMKSEKDALRDKLETEKDNSKRVTDQKNKLLEEINAHKNISKGLQEELAKTREQMETNKIELKNFYQGQVELVVQSKLKEFQNQLDEAEKGLKDELAKKELSIAKTAASHIQQISEKHSLEIKLLEEKHQEECRLYKLQISQVRHELEEANHKIKRQHEKHIHIEKQLHKFMESLRQDHVTTLDEINSFRSIEDILSFNMVEEERNKKPELDDSIKDTPVTSKNDKGNKRKEGSLQETIQMLLDRKVQEEIGHHMSKENALLYQKMLKDMKGKPPWK